MILGMAFCKLISVLLYHWQLISNLTLHDPVTNVYLLIDYGDFVDATTSNTTSPYVQLLSTTDPAAAHNDFVAARLNKTNTSGSQPTSSSQPSSGSQPNPGNDNGSLGGWTNGFFKKPIIAAVAGAVLLLQ